jgi:hypothetical protein
MIEDSDLEGFLAFLDGNTTQGVSPLCLCTKNPSVDDALNTPEWGEKEKAFDRTRGFSALATEMRGGL